MPAHHQQGSKRNTGTSEHHAADRIAGSTMAWAVEDPAGQVLADSTFRDEAHAWQVALGWPSEEEISDAKRRGYKAYLAEIRKPVAEVDKNVSRRTPGGQGNLL